MSCKYTYNGQKFESYQDLVEFLLTTDIDTVNDLLFRKADIQNHVYDQVEAARKSGNLNSDRAKAIDGGPELEANSNQFTTQTLIDSGYFLVDGEAPMFRMSNDAYIAIMKQRMVESGDMTQDQADAWGDNIQNKWGFIADNALDFHKMILGPHEESAYEWGVRAAGTAFSTISAKVQQAEKEIFREVMKRNGIDHRNNINTGKLLKNVNLETELKDMAETLLGHIDYLVVRDNGDIEIFNVKTSIEPYSQWAAAKKEKYKYQMAMLKRMLAYHGINTKNVRLNIIPVQLKYNDSFDAITDIHVQSADAIDMNDAWYSFRKYDNVAAHFIASNADFTQIPNDSLVKVTTQLQHIFPGSNVAAEGIKQTAKDWLDQNWGYCRPERTPEGGYKIIIPDTGEEIKVSDPRSAGKNEELVQIIQDRLNNSTLPFSGELSAYRIRTELENSFRSGIFNPPSGNSDTVRYIKEQFSKYFEVKKTTVDSSGKILYTYKWKVVDSPALDAANIIALQNVDTDQLDIFTISSFSPGTTYSFMGRKNLLGAHITDMNSRNFMLECNYGNIEAVRTLAILNEILPDIGGNVKLGRLQVIGLNNFQTQKGAYFELDSLLPEWQTIIDIVNQNTPANLTNNFKKEGTVCISPEEVLKQTWEEICSQDNLPNYAEIQALGDLIDQKVKADGTVIEGIMSLKTIEAKVEKLEALILRLRELAARQGLNFADSIALINASRANIDTTPLAKLYIAASTALSKYRGDIAISNEEFGEAQEYMMKSTSIGNSSVRRVSYLLQRSIDNIRGQILDTYMPIMDTIKEFYQDCGYTEARNRTIGDQALMFKNLYKLDENGNNTFLFKNPYDMTEDLEPYERKFLKKILYELYKVRCAMTKEEVKFTSAEDPNLPTDMPSQYLYVPLQAASSATKRTNLKDRLIAWGKKIHRLVTHPKEAFSELEGFLDKKAVQDRDSAMADLRVYNPYTRSFINMKEREAFIADKGVGFFETNLENIFVDFLSQQVKTDEFNKLLIRIKGIELALRLKGVDEGNQEEINHTVKAIDDYVSVNVYNKTIMGKNAQQLEAWLTPLRRLVSTVYIGANPVAAIRDTLQGLQENFLMAAIKYQTDINVKDVAFGYATVFKEGVTDLSMMNKLNQFNIKYGFSNFDAANVAERLKSGRTGLMNIDNMLYWTLRAPDYLNRMTLFTAKLHHDGIWNAYSLDENGRLKYNWRLDERFKEFAAGNTDSPEYNKQKALYMSIIREFNQEDDSRKLQYTDDLPDAYTPSQIRAIKTLSESIYGAYDKSSKAKYENIAIGRNLAFFSTWMNGIADNYFKTRQVSESEVQEVIETDYNGNPLFFTPDMSGNTTTEDTGLPVSKHMPLMVQGIIHTFGEAFNELRGVDYNLKEWVKSDIWKNKINQRNYRRLGTDMLVWAFLAWLFKMFITPAYAEHKKLDDGKNIMTNVMAEWLYKASSTSYDTFTGPYSILSYLGNSTNPATYKLQSKILNDAYNFVFGEKTLGQTLMGSQALLRSMQDSYRMYVRDTN